jgi:hypothetical protein
MKYLSQEWIDAVEKKLNSEEPYLKSAKNATMRFQWLATDCPGGVDKMLDWDIVEGKVMAAKLVEQPAPSDLRKAPFNPSQFFLRASASYDVWAKLNRKELIAAAAITSGIYKVDGDMAAIMPMMSTINLISYYMTTVTPVEY